MTYPGLFARGMRRAVTGMAVALGVYAALTGGALAQKSKDKKEKDKAAQQAPASKGDKTDKNNQADKSTPADKAKQAAAPAGGAKPTQSAWVKLCEKVAVQHKDKDGKDVKEEKNVCLTHLEARAANTGMLIVSAGIRQVEGSDKRDLVVTVPTMAIGTLIPPGIRAAVYSKQLWEKAQKNEKIDEKLLKPVDLKYSLCQPAACSGDIEATPELIEALKTGGGLMVFALNAAGQAVAFPVPLDGFSAAHAGPPVDNKAYAEVRSQFMQQVRQRQAELVKQRQAQQAEAAAKAPADQGQPSQPASAQPAPAKK